MHDEGDPALATLPDGDVLAVGNWVYHCETYSELYDPATQLWSVTGPMPWLYTDPYTLFPLPDGRVLAFGGGHAQIFDPATGTWSDDGMDNPTYSFEPSVALLQNGDLLIAGGEYWTSNGTYESADANIWDPIRQTLTPAAPLPRALYGASATTLPDGDVLVAGGIGLTDPAATRETCCNQEDLTSTEIYDPARNAWTSGPSLLEDAIGGEATLLPQSDEVVFTGGTVPGPPGSGIVEEAWDGTQVYDGVTNTIHSTGDLPVGLSYFATAVLADGDLMAIGGSVDNGAPLASTEIFDPQTEEWSTGPSLSVPRAGAQVTWLADGQLLVAGGASDDVDNGSSPVSTSEVMTVS